jgi:hypothetical protein
VSVGLLGGPTRSVGSMGIRSGGGGGERVMG